MKNTVSASRLLVVSLALVMCIVAVFSFSACGGADVDSTTPATAATQATTADEYDIIWEDAIYTEPTTIGEGKSTIEFEVKVGDNSVLFTVNTDKETVGDALVEHGLIAGDDGDYGLYVKTVNGILADYDVNSAYWAFYVNGEMSPTGVDKTELVDGTHYEMVYSK